MEDVGVVTGIDIRNAALALRAEATERSATRAWFTVQDVVERLDHRVDREEVEETLAGMADRGHLVSQPDVVAARRYSPPETLLANRRRVRDVTRRTTRR